MSRAGMIGLFWFRVKFYATKRQNALVVVEWLTLGLSPAHESLPSVRRHSAQQGLYKLGGPVKAS